MSKSALRTLAQAYFDNEISLSELRTRRSALLDECDGRGPVAEAAAPVSDEAPTLSRPSEVVTDRVERTGVPSWVYISVAALSVVLLVSVGFFLGMQQREPVDVAVEVDQYSGSDGSADAEAAAEGEAEGQSGGYSIIVDFLANDKWDPVSIDELSVSLDRLTGVELEDLKESDVFSRFGSRLQKEVELLRYYQAQQIGDVGEGLSTLLALSTILDIEIEPPAPVPEGVSGSLMGQAPNGSPVHPGPETEVAEHQVTEIESELSRLLAEDWDAQWLERLAAALDRLDEVSHGGGIPERYRQEAAARIEERIDVLLAQPGTGTELARTLLERVETLVGQVLDVASVRERIGGRVEESVAVQQRAAQPPETAALQESFKDAVERGELSLAKEIAIDLTRQLGPDAPFVQITLPGAFMSLYQQMIEKELAAGRADGAGALVEEARKMVGQSAVLDQLAGRVESQRRVAMVSAGLASGTARSMSDLLDPLAEIRQDQLQDYPALQRRWVGILVGRINGLWKLRAEEATELREAALRLFPDTPELERLAPVLSPPASRLEQLTRLLAEGKLKRMKAPLEEAAREWPDESGIRDLIRQRYEREREARESYGAYQSAFQACDRNAARRAISRAASLWADNETISEQRATADALLEQRCMERQGRPEASAKAIGEDPRPKAAGALASDGGAAQLTKTDLRDAPAESAAWDSNVTQTTCHPVRRLIPGRPVYCRDTMSDGRPGPRLAVIPPGRFEMGDGSQSNESPVHEVIIERSFAVGQYETTVAEYESYCRATGVRCPANPWGSPDLPVISVSHGEVTAFTQWLSQTTGFRYRLPSEAEWEYVARAGSSSAFPFGDTIVPLFHANFASSRPVRVDDETFKANAFGLKHVIGNVREWVADTWLQDYRNAPSTGAPHLQGDGDRAPVRGGSWTDQQPDLRSAARQPMERSGRDQFTGFRVARDFAP